MRLGPIAEIASVDQKSILHRVSRTVAMATGGWKTSSVYDRYNIVSEADIIEAGRKIAANSADAPDAQLRQDCHKFGTTALPKPTAEA